MILQKNLLSGLANQIRDLFAMILASHNKSNQKQMRNTFKDNMSEDILYKIRQSHIELAIEFNDNMFNETIICLENRCLVIRKQILV